MHSIANPAKTASKVMRRDNPQNLDFRDLHLEKQVISTRLRATLLYRRGVRSHRPFARSTFPPP